MVDGRAEAEVVATKGSPRPFSTLGREAGVTNWLDACAQKVAAA